MNDDPWSTALDRCLDNAYGEPEPYFDLHGNEFRLHGRRAKAGKIGPVNRVPQPSRPALTAYEHFNGNAYYHNGSEWVHCVTGVKWNG